jgi:hypothetical protein
LQIGTSCQEIFNDFRAAVEQMLAVVEDEKLLSMIQTSRQALDKRR